MRSVPPDLFLQVRLVHILQLIVLVNAGARRPCKVRNEMRRRHIREDRFGAGSSEECWKR